MSKAEEYAFAVYKNNTICSLMGWGYNFLEDRPDMRKRLIQKRLKATPADASLSFVLIYILCTG
jgi:hypothetical protein